MLNYDSQGFILGINRVEKQTKIVYDDTQKIIEILSHGGKKRQQQLQQTEQIIQKVNQNNRQSSSNNRHASQNASRNSLVQQRVARQQTRFRPEQNRLQQNTQDSQFEKADKARQFFSRLNHALKQQLENNIDSQNIDPLLDSVNEVKGVLSPMGKMFGFMFKAGAWTKNKLFANKKREPLSNAEERHQANVEEQLERIENNRSGGFRLNPFMKMFGKMGRMLWGGLAGVGVFALKHGKSLLKKLGGTRALGVLGTFIGAGNLAMDWDKLSDREKSRGVGGLLGGVGGAGIGALIGSVIFPGIGTAVGGFIGGWLGSKSGAVLGEYALPHIKNWVDSLISFDLPKQLLAKFSNGLSDLFKGSKTALSWLYDSFLSVIDKIKQKITEWIEKGQNFLDTVADGASSLWGDFKNALGFGGDFNKVTWRVDFGSKMTYTHDDVTYKMGGNGNGVIDCSRWVAKVNQDTVKQISQILGKPKADKAKIFAGTASEIIRTEKEKGRLVAHKKGWQDLDLSKLQAGMIIGESRGKHAVGRFGNIGHIVTIIDENGEKYVSESTSAKGADGKSGVRKTKLNDYVKNLNNRKFDVYVVDPYQDIRAELAIAQKSPEQPKQENNRNIQTNNIFRSNSVNQTTIQNTQQTNNQAIVATNNYLSNNLLQNQNNLSNNQTKLPISVINATGLQGSTTTPTNIKTAQAPKLKTTNLPKPPTIPQTTTKQKSQTLVANNQPLASNDRGLAHAVSGLSNDRQYG
ncbi:hypothetical protein [Faucicola boevrei]|uniref:hypothetical protein n=1 Tax=Faucicola boevrei TaxID=346665 RepID=UPI00036DF89E|nr:hypothetical protein [Moraxella boevrei]